MRTPEYIYNYQLQGGFELISMKTFKEEHPELSNNPFRTSDYHIMIPFNHVDNHLLDFNKVSLLPYSIFFTGRNKVHFFNQTAEYDGIAIGFTESFLCQNDMDLSMLQQDPLFNSNAGWGGISPVNIKDYISIVDAIQTELLNANKDELSAKIIRNLLHNFILLAVREFKKHNDVEMVKGLDSQITQRYLLLIGKNYKVVKSVAAYAQLLNITDKRLNIATANVLNKSAKAVIDEQVIIEAKRLIAFTNLSVKEVGFELGFSQATHFIKYFIKHTGKTPATFRAQHDA
jgi:AraC-like DNA-binding protein